MDVSPELTTADNVTPAADSALAYWTGNDGAWWYAQLTGSRNLPFSFWLLQAAGLLVLGLITWAVSSFWQRHMDDRVGWAVDRYLDATEILSRPLDRAVRWASPRIASVIHRRLPEQLQSAEAQWRLIFLGVCVLSIWLMALQHASNAFGAALSKGLHRTELPTLALGAARVRWGCARVRPEDGVLSQWLASLPLEASSWLLEPEVQRAWADDAPRWRAAAAHACREGSAPWELGRALLWPHRLRPAAAAADDRRASSKETSAAAGDAAAAEAAAADAAAADARAVDGVLYAARHVRMMLVSAPLQAGAALASWHLWGLYGASVTVVLGTFCPTLLAHSTLLTTDAPAALLLNATLWALWTAMHATSASVYVLCALAFSILLGLLLCCGPLAAGVAPAIGCMLVARALGALCSGVAMARRLTDETNSLGAGQAARRLGRRLASWLVSVSWRAALLLAVLVPWATGAVVTTLHGQVKRRPEHLDAPSPDAENAEIWARAMRRLHLAAGNSAADKPATSTPATASKPRKRGGKRHESEGTPMAFDSASTASSAPRATAQPSSIATLLVSLADALGSSTLLSPLLLSLATHHAAAIVELAGSGCGSGCGRGPAPSRGEWGLPPDAIGAVVGAHTSTAYLSGRFAMRSELFGASHRRLLHAGSVTGSPEAVNEAVKSSSSFFGALADAAFADAAFSDATDADDAFADAAATDAAFADADALAHFHLTAALLKTPPILFYFGLLLLLAALRRPVAVLLDASGLAERIRTADVRVWVRRQYSTLVVRSEWQHKVDAAFTGLIQRRREVMQKRMEERRNERRHRRTTAGDGEHGSNSTGDEGAVLGDEGGSSEGAGSSTAEPEEDEWSLFTHEWTLRAWAARSLWLVYRTAPCWAIGASYLMVLGTGKCHSNCHSDCHSDCLPNCRPTPSGHRRPSRYRPSPPCRRLPSCLHSAGRVGNARDRRATTPFHTARPARPRRAARAHSHFGEPRHASRLRDLLWADCGEQGTWTLPSARRLVRRRAGCS